MSGGADGVARPQLVPLSPHSESAPEEERPAVKEPPRLGAADMGGGLSPSSESRAMGARVGEPQREAPAEESSPPAVTMPAPPMARTSAASKECCGAHTGSAERRSGARGGGGELVRRLLRVEGVVGQRRRL